MHIRYIHHTHTHPYSLLRYRQLTLVCCRSEVMPPSSSPEDSWSQAFSISPLHGDLRGFG